MSETQRQLRLKSIIINRSYYGEQALRGTVEYESGTGKVEVNLTQDQLAGVLAVVASAIVAASRELASDLTQAIVSDAARALEDKSDEA
jgi:hypothetical protein